MITPARSITGVAAILLLLTSAGADVAAAEGFAHVVRATGPAVVSIAVYATTGVRTGNGSGFLLPDGRVVTNAHVVEGAARVEVFDHEGRLLGTVSHAVAYSSAADLAVLPGLGRTPAALPLASHPPDVGERVLVIGAPEGLTNTVSDGLVSAYRQLDGQRLMQISAPISNGSSGGPVLNLRGEVVGVSVAILRSGQNLNFAVPLDDLRAVVSSPLGHVDLSRTRPPGAHPAPPSGGDRAGSAPALRLRTGGTVQGHLGPSSDINDDGAYVDMYLLEGPEGLTVTIDVISTAFDTVVSVADPLEEASPLLGFDDDGGVGTNARLTVTLPRTGVFTVMASSYESGETGAYEIRVAADAAVPAGEPSRWAYVGSSGASDVFVDRESVRPQSGALHRAWIRRSYLRPYTDHLGYTYDREVAQYEYDCSMRRSRLVSLSQYLGERHVFSLPEDRGRTWVRWTPDSIGEGTGLTVCRIAGM